MSTQTDRIYDVVILGAGLAGMTAAYELRDMDILVLERDERVGGRTFSGDWEGYWYNLGAQFVWDERTLHYCRELNVEVRGANGARSALYVRGKLTSAPNPYLLLLKMPLSIREKVDFAWNIFKLRRLAARFPKVDRLALDSKSLEEVIPGAAPVTKQILSQVTESSSALPLDEVSAYIGLGYAIHLFGGDVNETLKGVVGGTQEIVKAMSQAVGEDRVRLGCEVKALRNDGNRVAVRYSNDKGVEETLTAKTCISTLPAGPLLNALEGLPPDKRAALENKTPYARVIIVVWLTEESQTMPWDNLVTVPIVGRSFDLISNHSFFVRRDSRERRSRGVIATLASGRNANELWDSSDEEIRSQSKSLLREIFPDVTDVFGEALIKRWDALPLFGKGSLGELDLIRQPLGVIHFAGDYTAQPGTPGAVGSGYYAAKQVRQNLTG